MTVIGITGGIGSGKTTALDVLREMGALVIDCDEVYRELLKSNTEMLAEIGHSFEGVIKDGELDRKALGRIVFDDAEALTRLNDITHKYVIAEVMRRICKYGKNGGALAAIDAIALIESGLAEKCDEVVGIIAPVEDRVRRLTAREGISEEYAHLRINAQPPDEYFIRNCGKIVNNNRTIEQFAFDCRELFEQVIREEQRRGK